MVDVPTVMTQQVAHDTLAQMFTWSHSFKHLTAYESKNNQK